MLVLDTGLRTHGKVKALAIEHPDLVGTARTHDEWRRSSDPLASDDDDEPDVNANHRLDLQSGHGTFIAGIVRQFCPEAVVHLEGVLSSFGDGDDDTIGEGLRRAVDRMSRIDRPPDVVVMSLCGYTDDDRPPPLTRAITEYVPPGQLSSRPPATAVRAASPTRPRFQTSSASAPSTAPGAPGSRTSAVGSTPARQASMW